MKIASMVKYTEKGKLVKKAQYAAFADEMDKIAGTWMTNVGSKIVKAVKAAPRDSMHAVTDFAKRPMQSMKEGWKATWDPKLGKGGGKLSGGLMLAGTAASVAGAVPKKDPTGRQESRMTRGMRAGAGFATGLAAAKHGIIPGIALGVAGDVAAGYAGRRIDKMRKYAPPGAVQAPPPEST